MTTKKETIISKATEALKSNPNGIRYSNLVRKIDEEFPEIPVNTIHGIIWKIPFGGNKFRDKWGTPDVIGKREPRRSDIVKAPTEIVSAEIKADTKDLITAFGQACSYKLLVT
jgi:hypothetical protein